LIIMKGSLSLLVLFFAVTASALRVELAAPRAAVPLMSAVADETCQVPNDLDGRAASFNKILIDGVKGTIDLVYRGRDIQRFYVLETIARVPYFSYLSCLHLYETLGMRKNVRLMRIHYAEADNELHHLLVMEALGGSEQFADRFVAQHIAFAYYWYCVAVYLLNPRMAYHLSELIEAHAYSTYDSFLRDHADELRQQPVPEVARRYYEQDDTLNLMLQSETAALQKPKQRMRAATTGGGVSSDGGGGSSAAPSERQSLQSLYDVFQCVRDDEAAHWDTLTRLVHYDSLEASEGCEVEAMLAAEAGA
jgi:ubiquinol oxidase